MGSSEGWGYLEKCGSMRARADFVSIFKSGSFCHLSSWKEMQEGWADIFELQYKVPAEAGVVHCFGEVRCPAAEPNARKAGLLLLKCSWRRLHLETAVGNFNGCRTCSVIVYTK